MLPDDPLGPRRPRTVHRLARRRGPGRQGAKRAGGSRVSAVLPVVRAGTSAATILLASAATRSPAPRRPPPTGPSAARRSCARSSSSSPRRRRGRGRPGGRAGRGGPGRHRRRRADGGGVPARARDRRRALTAQIADLYVRLKAAIGGDFYVIEADERRIVLGNRACPFGDAVRRAPGLCRMTSSVFGGIAARNAGGASVVLEERIALGDPECRVVVWLGGRQGRAMGGGARLPAPGRRCLTATSPFTSRAGRAPPRRRPAPPRAARRRCGPGPGGRRTRAGSRAARGSRPGRERRRSNASEATSTAGVSSASNSSTSRRPHDTQEPQSASASITASQRSAISRRRSARRGLGEGRLARALDLVAALAQQPLELVEEHVAARLADVQQRELRAAARGQRAGERAARGRVALGRGIEDRPARSSPRLHADADRRRAHLAADPASEDHREQPGVAARVASRMRSGAANFATACRGSETKRASMPSGEPPAPRTSVARRRARALEQLAAHARAIPPGLARRSARARGRAGPARPRPGAASGGPPTPARAPATRTAPRARARAGRRPPAAPRRPRA